MKIKEWRSCVSKKEWTLVKIFFEMVSCKRKTPDTKLAILKPLIPFIKFVWEALHKKNRNYCNIINCTLVKTIFLFCKGQILSKGNFGVFNSYTLVYWGRKIFVRFLEELKKPKRHFEINWPLIIMISIIISPNFDLIIFII